MKATEIWTRAKVNVFTMRASPAGTVQGRRMTAPASLVKLIDLSALPLTDDDFIPDGVHVSQRGSVVTSKQIINFELVLNNASTETHLKHNL